MNVVMIRTIYVHRDVYCPSRMAVCISRFVLGIAYMYEWLKNEQHFIWMKHLLSTIIVLAST
jgi:hypothetical protein